MAQWKKCIEHAVKVYAYCVIQKQIYLVESPTQHNIYGPPIRAITKAIIETSSEKESDSHLTTQALLSRLAIKIKIKILGLLLFLIETHIKPKHYFSGASSGYHFPPSMPFKGTDYHPLCQVSNDKARSTSPLCLPHAMW